MPAKVVCDGEYVTAYLSGEIDHHNAGAVRAIIDTYIMKAKPKKLTIDFGSVSFMDSSGVGLVMGRFKNISDYGGKMEITGLSPHAYKVMTMSGIEKIAVIHRKREEKKNEKAD
ncbi:MAG: anti-sigma factor antagonist [Clostridiales bacterium]|nr:anti-sigma factor antagonist [Clostridia bacterium]MCR4563505.1 anti-sigma factor antagonist [Clostridiales bacterium]